MSPSYQHSYVQSNVICLLKKFPAYSVFSELSLEIGGKEYVPDVCVYSKRVPRFSDDDIVRMTEMPLLAIEILSPSQSIFEGKQKVTIYCEAGVKSCWLVVPPTQTVTVYASPHEGQLYRTGEVVDAVVNIRIPLDDMFA